MALRVTNTAAHYGARRPWARPSPRLAATNRSIRVQAELHPGDEAAGTTCAGPACMDRRVVLVASATAVLSACAQLGASSSARAADISIVDDTQGFGTHPAVDRDIVLFHYVGTLEATGQVFDSTKGGMPYRDGGMGMLRPAAVQLGSGPVPGLCAGLRQGLQGMRVGGKRTVLVPPELGFGSSTVGAPYAVVPPNSTLRYEIELIRLSARGPDELTKGLARCGTGGASESITGCADITPAEYV